MIDRNVVSCLKQDDLENLNGGFLAFRCFIRETMLQLKANNHEPIRISEIV